MRAKRKHESALRYGYGRHQLQFKVIRNRGFGMGKHFGRLTSITQALAVMPPDEESPSRRILCAVESSFTRMMPTSPSSNVDAYALIMVDVPWLIVVLTIVLPNAR